jgi:hypothetical protein
MSLGITIWLGCYLTGTESCLWSWGNMYLKLDR